MISIPQDASCFTTKINFMQEALTLAHQAFKKGEVPIGAIVVFRDMIIGRGYNSPIQRCDPSAHAEMMALRHACFYMKNYRLPHCDLYVTVEPCMMCASAIVHSRIHRLYYGASSPKTGAAKSQIAFFSSSYLNHTVEIYEGLLAKESQALLQNFFRMKRHKQ